MPAPAEVSASTRRQGDGLYTEKSQPVFSICIYICQPLLKTPMVAIHSEFSLNEELSETVETISKHYHKPAKSASLP